MGMRKTANIGEIQNRFNEEGEDEFEERISEVEETSQIEFIQERDQFNHKRNKSAYKHNQ